MRIDVTTPENVRYVAERMRTSDYREFSALSHARNRAEMTDMLVDVYGNHPSGICAYLHDVPVAAGAMVEGRPNVMTLMFFATDDFPKIALPLTRFIMKNLFEKYRAEGVHRIECVSIDGYDEAHRWIKLLGLHHEAVFPGFGKNGEAFHQFSKVWS
jgi:hypothetical protein